MASNRRDKKDARRYVIVDLACCKVKRMPSQKHVSALPVSSRPVLRAYTNRHVHVGASPAAVGVHLVLWWVYRVYDFLLVVL